MPRMKRDELLSHVQSEIESAYTSNNGELSDEISNSLDYYLGKPFGNEEDGKSQVISRDVMDVIEWVMPSLMRIFTSNERAVFFDPVGPEDEDAAKQETDVINHIFYKENDGFLNLYTFFKDALLSKNGIMKVFWDPTKETEREEYKGLTDAQLQILLMDDDAEPIEHTENGPDDHDLTIIRTKSDGCAKVIPIPPEEFLISKDAECIIPSEARFTAHKTLKTRSELIEMGFPKRKVKDLPQYHGTDWYESEVALSRSVYDEEYFANDSSHESTELIEVHECYIKIDFDGDGIAELRQVTVAGSEVLLNEPADRCPFIAITPIILTHRFYGLSLADIVMDIQLIKSTLMRGILDNTYLANNGRTAIQDGMVSLDDLLTSRSGGVVRTLGRPSDVMSPIPYNPLPPQTFDVMGQMDSMRKERTGVSQDTMGLEANVLAHGRTGVINQSFDMAQMRTELIARIFAEVGVKNIMRELHAVVQKNQLKKKVMKIRGTWVEISPSEWMSRSNMTVNVGIGTGNKDKQIQSVMTILGLQKEALQTGRGVTEQNIYNSVEKLVEFTGLGDVSQFFTDPSTQPPPQPEPNVEEELAKAQIQLTAAQTETQRMEAQTNAQEAQWKHEEKMTELANKDLIERYKLELAFNKDLPGGL